MENPSYPRRKDCVKHNLFFSYFQGYKGYVLMHFQGYKGYIYSYFQGDKCEWRILATHGEKIVLNITTLDIPSSHNCNENYLEVFIKNEFLNR